MHNSQWWPSRHATTCRKRFSGNMASPPAFTSRFNQKDLAQAIRKALGDVRPEVKEEPGKAEAEPSSASPVIDLAPLTEFAGDDRNAAREILNTFLQETLLHAEAFKKAYEQKEKAEICRITHKLLPTFTLVGAPCIKALQTLEQRRDEQEWNDADNVPAPRSHRVFPPRRPCPERKEWQ